MISLQAGRSPATVPGASLPSVTLGTAAVVGVGVHQVIVLPLDRGKGCQGVGDDFSVGHLGLGHGSFRFDAVSLQGRGGGSVPPCATLEIAHHGADLQSVDLGVIPAATVWGLLRSTIPEQRHQFLIVAAGLGGIVERLVVLNPEGHVPGLPVCPSVESVAHGLSFG